MLVEDFYRIARAIEVYRPFKPLAAPVPKQPLKTGLLHLQLYSPELFDGLGRHPSRLAALELSIPSVRLRQLKTLLQPLC